MKKAPSNEPLGDDEMRPEYDFSGGVRDKYAERYARRFSVELVREGNGFVSLPRVGHCQPGRYG